jgi:beta-galactosidase
MFIGVDYYPEHQPKARWPKDAALMHKAGINLIRLAEFAWKSLEPEEGRFDFAWLDQAVALFAKRGISSVLGTPTACMPAWCARKHPDTLAVEQNGQRIVWGVRKNNCYSSPTFRLLSQRITQAMATRMSNAKGVIGWQIDNELSIPTCYCDVCKKEFHDWVRAKYKSIAEVNRAWGTQFWNHQYDSWDEITLPMNHSEYNPGLCLDWQRFHTWLLARFQREQVQIIRAQCPRHFITHNYMGLYADVNYRELVGDLDFVSWDNYTTANDRPRIRYQGAFAADLMRGMKKKNFWIMEQQIGPGGWNGAGRCFRPNEARNSTFQQVGRGADGMVFFPWRSFTAGREQYYSGLVDHDGTPSRRYHELARTAHDLHKIGRALTGTTVRSRIAFLYDYESLWATRIQPGYWGNDYLAAAMRYHGALLRLGVASDVVGREADFSDYDVIIAPDLYVMPDALARRLDSFVKKGGILLCDSRTGMKDETNLCHERPLPGLLGRALGIRVPEFESLEIEYPLRKDNAFGMALTAMKVADWVKPTTAKTLAAYEPNHMRAYAAVTRNAYGKGRGYYVGTIVKEEAFYDRLMQDVLGEAGIRPLLTPPAGVEASIRSGKTGSLLFLTNQTDEPKRVAIPAGAVLLLDGKKSGASVELDGFGVLVLQLRKKGSSA